jgi:hypothetical protein
MPDPVVPQLSLEAKLKFQLMRCEIKETADLELLQRKALMLVDMFEMQQRASNAMLQQTFLKPRPLHPSLFEAS